MSRRIAALAVLALMASLSACRCPSWYAGDKSSEGKASRMAHCERAMDCSACYRDESDRDMHRLGDDFDGSGYWYYVVPPR